MAETFGAMLRRQRVAKGFTQEALAERAAISATAVAALERGRRRAPRLSTLRQIARALDLDADELAAMAIAASAEADGIPPVDVPGPYQEQYLDRPGTTEASTRPSAAESAGSAGLRLPRATRQHWRSDFIGREAELDQLRRSQESGSRFNLVVGESGVGKTRLIARLAEEVHRSGAPVLWGRCPEERLGAYAPFVEVLRQLVNEAEPAALTSAVGTRGELTRLVPELVDKVGSLPAPSRAEAGTEQRLLFESVAMLLEAWTPLMVVIDDLHWADEASLALLAYLVRSDDVGTLTIVASARETDLDASVAGMLAGLARSAETSRLRLDGLGFDDLSSLVSDLLGTRADKELVHSIRSATDGNPFFAEEMTVHLIDSDLIVAAADGAVLRDDPRSAGIPQMVRDTLARRMLSLSGDSIDLLSAGSLMGREFSLSVAGGACGLEGSRLVESTDDALMSGLVVETSPGELSFSHTLVQHAVSERLSHARKAATHRRLAEALEAVSDDDPSTVAELARHWTEVAAVDRTASTVAAKWAVRAGDLALAAAAPDEAIARYEEASSLWAATTADHADALIRLGLALQYRGRADEADERFRQANKLAVVLGDAELQARAAIGLGRRYAYWETDDERTQVLEDTLAALDESGGLLRPTIMAMLVTHLIAGFNADEARHRDEMAAQVREVALDSGIDDTVFLSLGRTRIYDCFEDPEQLAPTSERLARVAERNSDLRVLAGARFAQAIAALDRADMQELTKRCNQYAEVVSRLDDPRERSQLATARSTVAFIEGRYSDAAASSDEALEQARASGDFNADLVHYAQGILRAVDQGQAEIVLPLLVDATEYQNIVGFAAGTALCAALAGDRDRALAALERFASSGFDGIPRGADWLAPTAFLAQTCSVLGARQHAEPLYAALRHQPSNAVRVGPLIGWWGTVDHHLGCLCILLGHLDEAEERLGRSLRLEEQMGARPFEARTLGALAGLERQRHARDPEGSADEMLARALEITTVLDAPGIATEIASMQKF